MSTRADRLYVLDRLLGLVIEGLVLEGGEALEDIALHLADRRLAIRRVIDALDRESPSDPAGTRE